MGRTLCLLAVLSLLAGNGATPALAASFDCARAQKPDEAAVCSDPALSELDAEMGALWFSYAALPFLMGMSGIRRDDAHAFLRDRSACGADIACLRTTYEARLKALEEGIKAGIAGLAGEQQAASPALPEPVEAIIAGYITQCAQLGGRLTAGADRPRVMASDLDGDGATDYVLNTQNLQCDGSATAFCGNGGCAIDIAVSGNGYRSPITALGGQPTISQRSDGTEVEIWVDGADCNLPDKAHACWATYSWPGGKVGTTYQARALAP